MPPVGPGPYLVKEVMLKLAARLRTAGLAAWGSTNDRVLLDLQGASGRRGEMGAWYGVVTSSSYTSTARYEGARGEPLVSAGHVLGWAPTTHAEEARGHERTSPGSHSAAAWRRGQVQGTHCIPGLPLLPTSAPWRLVSASKHPA